MRRLYFLLSFILLVSMSNRVLGQKNIEDSLNRLSPLDFGLNEAQTDSARYDVLYRTHKAAVESGKVVDYSGIPSLTIEITPEVEPIPLTNYNDFAGLELTIINNAKKCFVFTMLREKDSIAVDRELIDKGDFSSIPALDTGLNLLVIVDSNLWVEKRIGYNYGATRQDILLVEKGKALNKPISSYQTEASSPVCYRIAAEKDEKFIGNLTIKRSETNTYKAKCFQIVGCNNLKIKNVSIYTPKSTLVADEAISITHCTNLTMEDVKIDGSYSKTDYYGYGIVLNNVWNSQFVNLWGHANWGVFGTNNMSMTVLRDCNINRFDVHCYGRDVSFYNCKFSKLYNQFSSMYGQILFENCSFVNFTPVLIETSYNAYTAFDLVMRNCVFEANTSKYFLLSIGALTDNRNSRPELYEKCWPNITIKNLTVNVPDAVNAITLFKPKGTVSLKNTVGYISKIKIDGLKFNYSGSGHAADFYVASTEVLTKNQLTCQFNNVNIMAESDAQIQQATQKFKYPGSIHFNLHRNNAKDVIRITKSRLNYNANANAAYNLIFKDCTLGFVRYSTISNASRRTYKNCKIYLNCNDDKRYYLDNNASYEGCTFIPCSDNMFVDFFGDKNDVSFVNCKTTRKYNLIYKGKINNEELKKFSVKGARK